MESIRKLKVVVADDSGAIRTIKNKIDRLLDENDRLTEQMQAPGIEPDKKLKLKITKDKNIWEVDKLKDSLNNYTSTKTADIGVPDVQKLIKEFSDRFLNGVKRMVSRWSNEIPIKYSIGMNPPQKGILFVKSLGKIKVKKNTNMVEWVIPLELDSNETVFKSAEIEFSTRPDWIQEHFLNINVGKQLVTNVDLETKDGKPVSAHIEINF